MMEFVLFTIIFHHKETIAFEVGIFYRLFMSVAYLLSCICEGKLVTQHLLLIVCTCYFYIGIMGGAYHNVWMNYFCG